MKIARNSYPKQVLKWLRRIIASDDHIPPYLSIANLLQLLFRVLKTQFIRLFNSKLSQYINSTYLASMLTLFGQLIPIYSLIRGVFQPLMLDLSPAN